MERLSSPCGPVSAFMKAGRSIRILQVFGGFGGTGFGWAPEVNILQHESHIMELESHLQKAEWGLEGRAMETIAFFPVFLFLLLFLIICYHGP